MQIFNRFFFTDINPDLLSFTWSLTSNGTELGAGPVSVPPISPRGSVVIAHDSAPWAFSRQNAKGETFLTLTAVQAGDTRWAPKGHVVATQQVVLPSEGRKVGEGKERTWPKMRVEITDGRTRITSEDGAVQVRSPLCVSDVNGVWVIWAAL